MKKTMTLLEAAIHIAKVDGVSLDEAKRRLIESLSHGAITATGINSQTGKREAVPARAYKAKPLS